MTAYDRMGNIEYFYVMRKYSGVTANKVLLEVLSRRFKTLLDAENWEGFMKERYPKSEVFIMRKMGDI